MGFALLLLVCCLWMIACLVCFVDFEFNLFCLCTYFGISFVACGFVLGVCFEHYGFCLWVGLCVTWFAGFCCVDVVFVP